jgi:hypothetical protein
VFTITDLIAAPVPLGPELARRKRASRTVANILARKPQRFPPPTVPELRIPGDENACELIDQMLADLHELAGDDGLRFLLAAFEHPQIRAAGRPLDGGRRDYTMGSVVAGSGLSRFTVLNVRVRKEGSSRALEGIRCRLIDPGDGDVLRHELTAIYQEAEGREQLVEPHRPLAVWLRGNRAEVPNDWIAEAQGMAATYGFRLEVIREPEVNPQHLRTEIDAREPVLTLLWDHDGQATNLIGRARLDSLNVPVVRIQGAWEEAMLEAGAALADSLELAPPVRGKPRSVSAAVEAADTHDDVVLLPEAWRGASESPFRRPADVTVALNEIVAAVDGGALSAPGGLPAALKGGSFSYASGVSETARNSGDYRRSYDDHTIEIGPHLRLGGGGDEYCLRIYWCITGGKVVIGHIGKHLFDKGSS